MATRVHEAYALYEDSHGFMAPEQLETLVAVLSGRLDDNTGTWSGKVRNGEREGYGTIHFPDGRHLSNMEYVDGYAYIQTSPIKLQIVGDVYNTFVTASGSKYEIASVRDSLPEPGDPAYAKDITERNLRPELIRRDPDGVLVPNSGNVRWKISGAPKEAVDTSKGHRCKGAGSSLTRLPPDSPPLRAGIRRSTRLIGKKKIAK